MELASFIISSASLLVGILTFVAVLLYKRKIAKKKNKKHLMARINKVLSISDKKTTCTPDTKNNVIDIAMTFKQEYCTIFDFKNKRLANSIIVEAKKNDLYIVKEKLKNIYSHVEVSDM